MLTQGKKKKKEKFFAVINSNEIVLPLRQS